MEKIHNGEGGTEPEVSTSTIKNNNTYQVDLEYNNADGRVENINVYTLKDGKKDGDPIQFVK